VELRSHLQIWQQKKALNLVTQGVKKKKEKRQQHSERHSHPTHQLNTPLDFKGNHYLKPL